MGSFLLSAVQVTKTANDLFGLFSSLAGFAFDETDRVIEGRRLEQFQFLTSGEGRPIPRVWGRMRIGGHVIFADAVRENMASHDVGGKGSGGGATRREYRYTMSFAVGLCQGEVRQVGRIWADGEELDLALLFVSVGVVLNVLLLHPARVLAVRHTNLRLVWHALADLLVQLE